MTGVDQANRVRRVTAGTDHPVTVIGIAGGRLDDTAEQALAAADLVVGGARHLELVSHLLRQGTRTVVTGPLDPALDAVTAHTGPVAVLASGDPGWFGIVRALRERGITARVLPAPSSVALLAARLGLPHDGIVTVSAHGRDPRAALNTARALPLVAVLTGPQFTPADLAQGLAGWDRRLVVAERLGHSDERITQYAPDDADRAWAEPNVVLVTDPARAAQQVRWNDQPAAAPSGGWALPEAAYRHRDAMVTKAEIRALVVARLAPSLGRLVWDVGAGSGSVAVECASLGAAVVAVDRDAAACADVAANAQRHSVSVRVVDGEAPGALDGLPWPDAAFIGGGGTRVVAAVTACGVPRIVVACAALEHAVAARAGLRGAGYQVDGAQVAVSRLTELPDGSARLAALNPVTVLWADAVDGDRAVLDRPGRPERNQL